MSLIMAGGWIMVPLLLISVLVLSIVFDRMLVYCWNPMPGEDVLDSVRKSLEKGSAEEVGKILAPYAWLGGFKESLCASVSYERYESEIEGSLLEVRTYLERRLAFLLTLSKVAPLLGLLGTVIGMIQTFAVVAHSASGINMEVLADGIWQALITTATGLIIAIPAIILYRVFLSAEEKRLNVLSRLATTACLIKKEGKGADHD